MGSKTITTTLGEYLTFKNGKKSPDRDDNGCFNVFGSNGKIGKTHIANSDKNTIVIGRVGSYCGSVHFSDEKCWVTDNAIACVAKSNEPADFWFYLLGYLNLNQYRSGSGQPLLNQSILNSIKCSIPSSIESRAKIGHYLLSLDNKITLNCQVNQTLEQMAQVLFKSWFVDFDPVVDNALDAGFFEQDLAFPDELLSHAEARRAVREHADFKPLPEATRQLFPAAFEECAEPSLGLGGWVPQGWQALQFGEFIHRKSVGKKYDQKSASAVGKIPILDQGKSGVIGYHDDEPGVRASLDSPVVVFANHTCYMRLISFDFSAIQNVLPFTGKDVDTTWAFYATQDRVRFSEYKGHWPDFVIEKTIVPSLVLTTKFREYVDSLIRSVRCNELQNQTLINLRDTLLPKLISGELRLDNIEAGLANEGVA
ncbi:restriction endonuclease subunit S [Aeromonas salmonicida]